MQETRETQFRSLGWEDSLQKEMATHSSILAWRIPCRGAWRAAKSQAQLKRLNTHAHQHLTGKGDTGQLGEGPGAVIRWAQSSARPEQPPQTTARRPQPRHLARSGKSRPSETQRTVLGTSCWSPRKLAVDGGGRVMGRDAPQSAGCWTTSGGPTGEHFPGLGASHAPLAGALRNTLPKGPPHPGLACSPPPPRPVPRAGPRGAQRSRMGGGAHRTLRCIVAG